MGTCSSKEKYNGDVVDKNHQLKQQSLSQSQLSYQQQQQQQEAINKKHQDEHKNNLNQVAINWKPNTVGIWKRSYDKLAIHTDIPRLGHKIEIIDKLDRLSNINFVNLNNSSSTSIATISTTTTNPITEIETTTNNNNNNNNTDINNNESSISVNTSTITIVQNGASEGTTTPPINNNTTTTTTSTSTPISTITENNNSFSVDKINQATKQAQSFSSDKYTSLTTLTSTGQLATSQVLKKEEVVLQVLSGLTYLLDGEEKEKHIREQFPNYIKTNGGDISQQLLGFLAEIGENSRVMSLLKVCHQKVILPSYYFIKSNLFEDLPFRDKRGSWRMRITIEEDQTIAATHSKRQQSTVGSENDPEFEFEWALTILFDKDMNISNLKVNIVDLIISPNITNDRKQIIQKSFSILQTATQTTNATSINPPNDPIPLNKVDQ